MDSDRDDSTARSLQSRFTKHGLQIVTKSPLLLNWMLILAGGLVALLANPVQAADPQKIKDAIRRAQNDLLNQPLGGGEGGLAAYALLKSEIDKNNPVIQKVVGQVLTKFNSGVYRAGSRHNYDAGVDAMLLEAVDPVLYRPQLQMIADYLISIQRQCGAWNYSDVTIDGGDTSITQYAILGLWAASRAGVEIPVTVWERAAKWHIDKQLNDGQFVYHPYDNPQDNDPDSQRPRLSMTVAASGSLLILRRLLFAEARFHESVRPAGAGRRFGVLEAMPDDKAAPIGRGAAPAADRPSLVSIAAIDRTLKPSLQIIGSRLMEKGPRSQLFYCYYFYAVERVAALLDIERLGDHNWYDEGADELLLHQHADGYWTDASGRVAATSLAVLFLSKATAKSLPPKPKRPSLVGGGLLAGGRGLPDNLDVVQVKDGQVAARKLQGRVDGLLADLEKSSDAKVEDVQAAVVEAVQLDRPEDLIGQVDRLKKLATDTRVEVRRTAMWALGRTGNISVAPLLIRGLTDVDESVMREASLGLSILSRRPEGCGLPLDPTDGLKEDAPNEGRQTHLDKWGKESTNRWQKWYLKVRPYVERDDRTLLKRKS